MPRSARRFVARRLAKFLPRRFARLVRNDEGAAAVEFALVAAPFFALLFAVIETAMVFFASQTLEAATADAARLIMTGQAQTNGYSAADFKTQVCNRIYGLFDCSGGIYVNVKNYSNFSSASTTSPVSGGQLVTSGMTYSPGGPNCIVVVQVFYQWPLFVTGLGYNISNLSGNKRLLVATSVFRNEPYATNAC